MKFKQRSNAMRFITDATGYETLLAFPPEKKRDEQANGATAEASVAGVGPEELTAQVVLSVDTPAFDLLRLGYTVTIQPQDEEYMVTVERRPDLIGGSLTDQSETAAPVQTEQASGSVPTLKKALTPKWWPASVGDILPELVPINKKLKPVALLQQACHRRVIPLPPVGRAKRPSTVVADLETTTVLLPPSTFDNAKRNDAQQLFAVPSAVEVARLYDLAVDRSTTRLKPSTLERRLQQVTALNAAEEGQVERALLALSTHAPSVAKNGDAEGATDHPAGIQPTMSMVEACRVLLYQQLVEMMHNEAGVRYSTEIEYVHQMRVAIRRLRAAAKLFGQTAQRKALRPHLKYVRKTGKLLGAVRDLDVAIDKAQKTNAKGKTKCTDTKQIDQQIQAWQQARREAHATLVDWLDSAKYWQFLADFYTFCAPDVSAIDALLQPEQSVDLTATSVAPEQVRHVAPGLLMERFAAVRCYETLWKGPDADLDAVPYPVLHALRIECKYLRYSLEFTQHLLGPPIKPLIKELKKFQDLLGDLNDAVVAVQMLEAEQAAKNAQKKQAYLAHQQELIHTLRAQVPLMLQTVVGPGCRQILGEAIATL